MYIKDISTENGIQRWVIKDNGQPFFNCEPFSQNFIDELIETSTNESNKYYEKGVREGVVLQLKNN